MSSLTDAELKAKTSSFKQALESGATLDDLMYEAFAVVREASKRVLQMRHFDEQLIGGMVLHRGMISEMRTGEGKTLVATLPAYLNALSGKGVHVVTVNDYLAQRDADWMRGVYEFLGLKVSCVTGATSEALRKQAYQADITYITANQLGFDYLHDNMKLTLQDRVQRKFSYALIDEVDSILIDEARNPLIISGPANDSSEVYVKVDRLIRQLSPADYEKDEEIRTVHLTDDGLNKIDSLLASSGLINPGSGLYDIANIKLVHYVQQALRAHTLFAINVDYMVQEQKNKKGKGVYIIDKFTGRIMEGRRYSEGLHQALEAKEGIEVQQENQTLASITFQNYFRLYDKIAGMTGTAMTEAAELKSIYSLEVISIPTHNPVRRIDHDDEIYGTKEEKYQAILKTVQESHAKGQPVLIGTVSIEKSEELSELFHQHNIAHQVLNAKYHEQEAKIIAQAGRYKAVTIATNMAGRGTDIMLGGNFEMLSESIADTNDEDKSAALSELKNILAQEKDQVLEAGGLKVIGSERHESRRIDNQLRGRAGRQGDPGQTLFLVSLEDELMRIFISKSMFDILHKLGLKGGEKIQHPLINRAIERAQQKIESQNYEIRKNLLKYDDIMNEQRKIIYNKRDEVILESNIAETVFNISDQWIDEVVPRFIPQESFREQWQLEDLAKEVHSVLGISLGDSIRDQDTNQQQIIKDLQDKVRAAYSIKLQQIGEENLKQAVKYILLATLDQLWKEHLHSLDHLKQGISLRAYGQKDPLIEYRNESFKLFENMLFSFLELFLQRFSHLSIDLSHLDQEEHELHESVQRHKTDIQPSNGNQYNTIGHSITARAKPNIPYVAPTDRDPANPESWGRIGRNEICPCGSGKKYKYCHGLL